MEVTLTVVELVLWAGLVLSVGIAGGFLMAGMFTCGKIDDLEREILQRDLMLAELQR